VSRTPRPSQPIDWAPDTQRPPIEDVQVDHRSAHVRIAGLASDLEGLMLGEPSDEDFRCRYPSELDSKLSDAIWRNLEHYLADTDIRAEDASDC
jgi:hypothetical protein